MFTFALHFGIIEGEKQRSPRARPAIRKFLWNNKEELVLISHHAFRQLARGYVFSCTVAAASLATAQELTVVSWGGAFAGALEEAIIKPFEQETGIAVRLEDYNGGLAQIRAQVESSSVFWDVVDVELFDGVRGCDEGLFEPLDFSILAPAADGASIEEDFYPDTLSECGLATIFYSTAFAYNDETIGDRKPEMIADFFDLEKFPGRRGMRQSPVANLEFALMADGVPAAEVYAVLDTDAGLDRAFDKLDTIKDEVVWWQVGAQPPQLLADGEVVMTTAYNGRIFNAQALENQPFVLVWDGQVLDTGQFAVVAGTERLDEAQRFIEFSSRPESLAGLARYIAYSPTRRSAEPLISTHAETGMEMSPHMPNAPENTTRALRNDWSWWSDNADDMTARFVAWLLDY